jgi:metallo-beta-lactamase family protein
VKSPSKSMGSMCRCAQVVQMGNLSAHADYEEILAWLSHFDVAPKMTFLTHGELEAATALGQRVQESLDWRVKVPAHGDRFTL